MVEMSGQLHASAALLPRKGAPVPLEEETGWGPEPVWAFSNLTTVRPFVVTISITSSLLVILDDTIKICQGDGYNPRLSPAAFFLINFPSFYDPKRSSEL